MTRFKWTIEKIEIAKNLIVARVSNQEIIASIGCKLRTISKFRLSIESGNDVVIHKRGGKSDPDHSRRLLSEIRSIFKDYNALTQRAAADLLPTDLLMI